MLTEAVMRYVSTIHRQRSKRLIEVYSTVALLNEQKRKADDYWLTETLTGFVRFFA